jgi:hypothetical protein
MGGKKYSGAATLFGQALFVPLLMHVVANTF